jgi:hypothetical protein
MLHSALKPILGDFQVIECLRVQPEAGAGVEVASETQSRIWSDASPFMNNLSDASYGHMKVERQPVHADAKRHHEILAKDLTGMDRWKLTGSNPGHSSS